MTRISTRLVPFVLLGMTAFGSLAPVKSVASTEVPTVGALVDCSDVYGVATTCRVVSCGRHYSEFLGVWTGPFREYVQSLSTPQKPVFRPYQNRISYVAADCLRNPADGATFIVGRQTDSFPAFESLPAQTKQGLLITGQKADGTAFLRTVGGEGRYDYELVPKDAKTEGAVWKLNVPASRHPCPSPENAAKMCGNEAMEFRIHDSREQSHSAANVRDVVIDMAIGPADHPYWQGVIAQGQHEKQKSE